MSRRPSEWPSPKGDPLSSYAELVGCRRPTHSRPRARQSASASVSPLLDRDSYAGWCGHFGRSTLNCHPRASDPKRLHRAGLRACQAAPAGTSCALRVPPHQPRRNACAAPRLGRGGPGASAMGGAPLWPPWRPEPRAPDAWPPGAGPTGAPAPSVRRRGAATRGRPRGASAGSRPGPATRGRPGRPALSVPSPVPGRWPPVPASGSTRGTACGSSPASTSARAGPVPSAAALCGPRHSPAGS